MEEGRQPRVANLALGLARDLEAEPPRLHLIPSGGPNALVLRSSGPVMAVARSLLEGYTRTELEAVVAHCLVRLRDRPRMRRIGVDIMLGLTARSPLGPSARSPLGPGHSDPSLHPRGLEDDIATVSVTRYPPALASAISKAEPAGGRFAPLWFVGGGQPQMTPERRVAELSDF